MKSKKSLEEFVAKNRADFEEKVPDQTAIWERLSTELQNQETETKKGKVVQIPVKRIWQVAAAVLLLMGVYFGSKLYQVPEQANGLVEQETVAEQPNLAELNPELAETEQYYTQLISQKKVEIEKFIGEHQLGEHKEVQESLNHLDSMYTELKQEFYQAPAQEQIVAAMIRNLQMRIEVLNQQLHILQQINQIKTNKQNETSI